MQRLFIVAIGVTALYGLGAFVAWDYNPGHWDEFSRFILSAVVAAFAFVVAIEP